MWGDKVLEEVRAAREAHAARFGFDLGAIVADLRNRESTSGHEIVMPKELTGNGTAAPNHTQHQTSRKAGPLVS